MIVLYNGGTGMIGTAIRWQTRGPYSHAGWMARDGSSFEAWHMGGVMHLETPFSLHEPGTRVDIYDLPGLRGTQRDRIEDFLRAQVGCGYDWFGVLRFLSGINRNNSDRWFCSELIADACRSAGRPLLRAASWKLSPSHLAWSTEARILHSQVDRSWWEQARRNRI